MKHDTIINIYLYILFNNSLSRRQIVKKVWADKWVTALRSGKYQKGRYALNKNNKLCCLGVLCEITGTKKELHDVMYTRYDGAHNVLPESVSSKTGMSSDTGHIQGLGVVLTVLNDTGWDTKPLTFDEIADIIQINWKEL